MEVSSEIRRSLVAGASLVVLEGGLGFTAGKVDIMALGLDGVVMAGASYACDLTHTVFEMPTTLASSAVCSGAIYTIAKSVVFNNNNLVMNFLLAAAADAATDYVNDMLPAQDHM